VYQIILFWNDTLRVSGGLSVYHREFKTVHTATGICQTDTAVCLLASRQQYLFDIFLLLYVQFELLMMDDVSVHHQEFKTVHNAVCLLASKQQYLFDKCLLLYVQS